MKIPKTDSGFTLIDLLFIGYMAALGVLLIFFHRGVEYWPVYIAAHALIIVLIVAGVPYLDKSENKIAQFLRWWYPIFMFTFNYKEIGRFTNILVPGWMDGAIMSFEKSLFGVHPTLWMENFVNPLLTEVMKFNYFTYYIMIPLGAAALYFYGKRKNYVRYLATVCVAFYLSYIGFIIYPVRGPRYELYDQYTLDYEVNIKEFYGIDEEENIAGKDTMALKGYFFTPLQDSIMRYGSLYGGCMPSSHIAVALVCTIFMGLYFRKLFYFYLPTIILLCISVVYNRYHYITDVVAGLGVGVLAFWLTSYGEKLFKRYGTE
ncbi:MAG: phosphatase PAP2 family protein [Elusimicrobiota bacterium]